VSRPRLLRRNPRQAGFEPGIELADLLPAEHAERFDELADTVDFGEEQAKLGDLFITGMPREVGSDFVFVDRMFAPFEQLGIMQGRLLALLKRSLSA
jgi:hypothetical protein